MNSNVHFGNCLLAGTSHGSRPIAVECLRSAGTQVYQNIAEYMPLVTGNDLSNREGRKINPYQFDLKREVYQPFRLDNTQVPVQILLNSSGYTLTRDYDGKFILVRKEQNPIQNIDRYIKCLGNILNCPLLTNYYSINKCNNIAHSKNNI